MTKYEHLLELQSSGELRILIREYGLSPHFLVWMEIFAYHLQHPKLSQFQISLHFGVSKAKVWEAYRFMNQRLTS